MSLFTCAEDKGKQNHDGIDSVLTPFGGSTPVAAVSPGKAVGDPKRTLLGADARPSKTEMLGDVNVSDGGTMQETRQDNHAANISLLCAENVITPLLTWISKEFGRSENFVMRAPTKFTTEVGFPI